MISRPSLPASIRLDYAGTVMDVSLKPNNRAKRLILRIDLRTGEPVLTCPPGIGLAKIRAFLTDQKDWLAERCKKRDQQVPLVSGSRIPLRGTLIRLKHIDRPRYATRLVEDNGEACLKVGGEESHMARRVTDWLKQEARNDLTEAVDRHASVLNIKPAALRIKDTKSRWGSCSAGRVLSFSWRIILAPPFALDYLAAHEVAHLKEMNHSARFWALVNQTCPDMERGKVWLKKHGPELHLYN